MRYAVWIVSSPHYLHSECFREVAETIDAGLKSLGLQSCVTTEPMPGARHIVLGWHNLSAFGLECPPDSIIYNLEQLEGNHIFDVRDHAEFLRKHTIWDYCKENAAFLLQSGLTLQGILPICYHDILTKFTPRPDKEIDVLFIGSISDRRTKILTELKRRGLNAIGAFGVYGAERDARISASKLLLNIHTYKACILEQVRISHYLANSVAVLSEFSGELSTDREWSAGVAFCEYEEMVDRAEELCRADAEREALARRGFAFFRKRRIEPFLKAALSGVVPADDVAGFPEFRRNGPCFCGSGLRYKHCHGSLRRG